MVSKPKPVHAATAYSYVRFSSPEQAKGDSRRRQEELRDAWLTKSGAVLDTSLSLRDEGVSAFTGGNRQNPDRHALAAFLELVRRGRIQRGSYLVVESLDRLSREHIRPALTLLLNLIDAGIRIVQLLPVEAVYDESVEPMTLMMAIMELSRGHSESRMKSERVGGAWAEKKRNAAKDGKPITGRVPAWLSVRDGRFVVDEAKAEAVRHIYRLAASGFGLSAITKRLNAAGATVPIVGPGPHWARSYVTKILSNRAVLGEYQPHTRRGGKRRPDGSAIPDYFPAVITEDQWHAARAALVSRRQTGGPASPRLNLFGGLLRDARDHGAIHQVNKSGKGYRSVTLVSSRAVNGVKGAKYVSFPADAFERALLSCLREINPRDVLPEGNGAADRVLTLTGRRDELAKRLDKLKTRLIDGEDEDDPLVDVLRSLNVKLATTQEQLADAQREAACPLTGAWGECRSVLDALDGAPDPAEARVRLRSAVRGIIESIWCLFCETNPGADTEHKRGRGRSAGRGSVRLAAVQVWFAGGAHRDYLMVHRPAAGGRVQARAAECRVWSLSTVAAPGALDLRRKADVRQLEKVLTALDLDALAEVE